MASFERLVTATFMPLNERFGDAKAYAFATAGDECCFLLIVPC